MLLYVFTGTLDSVINANYAALNYPERFYAAASFSSELSLAILNMIPDDPRQKEFSQVFGDLGQLEGTQHDSMVWLQKAAEALYGLRQAGRPLPLNQMVFDAAQGMSVPIQYETEDGEHNWPCWDKYIQRFLAWALGEPEG